MMPRLTDVSAGSQSMGYYTHNTIGGCDVHFTDSRYTTLTDNEAKILHLKARFSGEDMAMLKLLEEELRRQIEEQVVKDVMGTKYWEGIETLRSEVAMLRMELIKLKERNE